MKITVDIDDFWLQDDEQDISEAIKVGIKREVRNQVVDSLKKEINELSSAIVKEIVGQKAKEIIEEQCLSILDDGLTIEHRGESFTIEELLKREISSKQEGYGRKSIFNHLEEKASNIVSDMKEKYDHIFASLVVKKLGENNLLKDENVAKLLEEK